MSNNSSSIPIDSGGNTTKLKAAPGPFKLQDTRERTAVTENNQFSPITHIGGNNTTVHQKGSSYSMVSKSFGGDSSPYLSTVMDSAPLPGSVQRCSTTGAGRISYSGYLYKRSNFPHRPPVSSRQENHHDHDYEDGHAQRHPILPTQQKSAAPLAAGQTTFFIDPSDIPDLPSMPGMFSSSSLRNNHLDLMSDHQPWPEFHSPLAIDQQSQQLQQSVPSNSTAAIVTPSPVINATVALSNGQQDTPSTSKDIIVDNKPPTQEKSPFQRGLESAAAFFGIQLGGDGEDYERQSESSIPETPPMPSVKLLRQKTTSPIKMAPSNAIEPTTRRAIPIPSSSNYQAAIYSAAANRKDSFQEANHRRHSAPSEMTPPNSYYSTSKLESNQSFGTHDIKNMVGSIPQDFYDPEDGHLWRAKYCVLEGGVLYFYRNANDGESIEAAAERKRTHHEGDGASSYSPSNATGNKLGGPAMLSIPPSTSTSTLSRRMSSAKDLSKSPMVRPILHQLSASGDGSDSSGNPLDHHCMWEKRVFLECVEEVRTAEQQFGKNSFELTAVTDEENHVDKLILLAPNQSEMNEWIFQFHRSLASFMRNIMDVFGSTSASGVFLDIHRPANVSESHSSRPTPLRMAGSIPNSPSEKQLQRLIAMSPRFHHHLPGASGTPIQTTLSHGHGRTSLRRRTDLKRTISDGSSSSISLEAADTDSPQHQFAFQPSPSNLLGAPETISPPPQFVIPPPTTGASSTATAMGSLRGGVLSLESYHRTASEPPPRQIFSEPELSGPASEVPEMERPKPGTGKYIPPHLRNKQGGSSSALKPNYVPPHLRRQLDAGAKKYTPPHGRSCGNDKAASTPPMSGGTCSETMQLAPTTPTRRESPVGVAMPSQESLDVVAHSTMDFIRGGCADPQMTQGSIFDRIYIPEAASSVKVSTAAFGSYGGGQLDEQEDINVNLRSNDLPKSSLRWEMGAVSECGIREFNEDAFLVSNDLLNAFKSSPFDPTSQTVWTEEEASHSPGLFAIFDGHCGNQAARYAVERIGHVIHERLGEDAQTRPSGATSSCSPFSPRYIEAILRDAIIKMDDDFCKLCQDDGRKWVSGSTALVAMIANENLVIANLGDSRGVLCRCVEDTAAYAASCDWLKLEDIKDDINGSERISRPDKDYSRCFWKEVTDTHSPASEKEKDRIEKANGWITTEREILFAQLRRMDLLDADVIAILKRCLRYLAGNDVTSDIDSERSTKECKAAPQRILQISRICGELAVSRALGDRDFKAAFNTSSSQHDDQPTQPQTNNDIPWWDSSLDLIFPKDHNNRFRGDLVSNIPDFQRIRVGEDGFSDEFLLLACDGLWDVMDTDDAVRVVRDLLFHKKWTAKKAAARLAELAIHLGSSDNVTVIVVRFFSVEDKNSS